MNMFKGIFVCQVVCVFAWLLIHIILGVEDSFLSVISSAAALGLLIGSACALFNNANSVLVGALVPFTISLLILIAPLFFGIGKSAEGYIAAVVVSVTTSAIGAVAGYCYKRAAFA